jgi:tetratricopeptide (TPR) repeat protein
VPDASPFDLFVSYSRRDDRQGRVSDLAGLIRESYRASADGKELRVFFDTEEIHGMDDWQHRILYGIRSARLLLVCLSPSYFESEYCAWEFNEYLKQEAARALLGEGIAPVYFLEIPNWTDKNLAQGVPEWATELQRRQYFDLRPWFSDGAEALEDGLVKTQLDHLNDQIRDRLSRIRLVIDAKGNVDRHNEHFVGRAGELRLLREMVGLGKMGVLTAIHGLGGIGKTALATEYAHVFAHEYPGGRWQVQSEGHVDLRVALAALAGARDLEIEFTDEEKGDLNLQFERILRELKKRAQSSKPSRVLLVLDNVDHPKLIEPAQLRQLPQADWLHLIATTRLGESDLFGTQPDRAFLSVDELPEEDALALVERYQPGNKFSDETEREAARNIVRLLGGFTLAVEAAAVFLGQYAGEVNCRGFNTRMEQEGLEGLEKSLDPAIRVRHDEIRLTATLRSTLERLSGAERVALTIASLLPAEHIALPWVRVLVANEFPEFGKDAPLGYPDPWRSLIRRLYSLRLLQVTAEPNEARMHRLLQEAVRLSDGSQRFDLFERELLAHAKVRSSLLWKGWVRREHRWELAPLAAYARRWMERGHPDGAFIANEVAGPLEHLGRLPEAESLLRQALSIDENAYGSDHPEVAVRLSNLGSLLHKNFRLEEAERLIQRALDIDQRCLGPQHPTVATRLSNLTLLYASQGRYAEAEPLIRRALDIDEQCFGPNHPDIARDLTNLGHLLEHTNRIPEAAPLYRRALAIEQAHFGPDHPEVARTRGNLAGLLRSINQLEDAELLFREALAINEEALGPNHPDVARELSNIAAILKETDRQRAAEPLYRRALKIAEENFRPDHPEIARYMNNLATCLFEDKKFGEAEPLLKRALAIDEQNLGPRHPRIATRLNNLAGMLLATGRIGQAESLMRRAIDIDREHLDPADPQLAIHLSTLAQIRWTAKRLKQAEPVMREALGILFSFSASTGHHHPKLNAMIGSYRTLLTEMGDSAKEIRTKLDRICRPFGFEIGL